MAIFHQEIDSYFTILFEAQEKYGVYMTSLIQEETKRVFVADKNGKILGYMIVKRKNTHLFKFTNSMDILGPFRLLDLFSEMGLVEN